MEQKPIYVLIEPTQESVTVHYAWRTLFDETDSGMVNCYVPGFDLFFCAKDKESGNKKSKAMMKIFIRHFIDKKNGIKSLALELHKLGFKAPNDQQTMTDLVKNKIRKTKFTGISIDIPERFMQAEPIDNQLELQV